jgi:hypothetical protein
MYGNGGRCANDVDGAIDTLGFDTVGVPNSALRHAVFVSFGDDDTVVDSLL